MSHADGGRANILGTVNDEREPAEFVARAMSTRPVKIRGTNHLTRFTLEALEDMADQVANTFLPFTIEHLDFLPPAGRWYSATVVPVDDGEHELEMRGRELPHFVPASDDPPRILDLVDELPVTKVENGWAANLVLRVEPRNFDPDAFAAISDNPPIPVAEEAKWSDLPPLLWTLSIPVIWGATKFAGAFFETLGTEFAESFAKWVRGAWNQSKEPNRDRMLKLSFELDDGTTIYGFIPSTTGNPDDDLQLEAGLDAAGVIAAFAGLQAERGVLPKMQSAAFMFKDEGWELAWWTDGTAVFSTHWFDRNQPDPTRYLGRPLIDSETAEPGVEEE